MSTYRVVVSCIASVLVAIDVEADSENAAMESVASRIDAGEELISRDELAESFDQQIAKSGDYDIEIIDCAKA